MATDRLPAIDFFCPVHIFISWGSLGYEKLFLEFLNEDTKGKLSETLVEGPSHSILSDTEMYNE
jgi:hypothetical protein